MPNGMSRHYSLLDAAIMSAKRTACNDCIIIAITIMNDVCLLGCWHKERTVIIMHVWVPVYLFAFSTGPAARFVPADSQTVSVEIPPSPSDPFEKFINYYYELVIAAECRTAG